MARFHDAVPVLGESSTLFLVGATHARLPEALEEAWAARGRARWTQVEVFFLSREGIDALFEDAADVRWAERARVRAWLELNLPSRAETWALYEYDVPYFFASCFDHRHRGGRVRVSLGTWGASDLRGGPVFDLAWTAEDPPAQWNQVTTALERLRPRARRLGPQPVGVALRSVDDRPPEIRPDAYDELSKLLYDPPSDEGGRAAAVVRAAQLEVENPGLHAEVVRTAPAEGRALTRCGEVRSNLAFRWGDREAEPARPTSLSELALLLASARAQGRSLRAVGAGRAMSRVSDPTDVEGPKREVVAVSMCRLTDTLDVRGPEYVGGLRPHTPRRLYRCQAGRPVESVIRELRADDRALANHGSGWFQAIVGAVSTGTHGSGAKLPPLSGLVRALTVLRPEGTSVRIELIQGSLRAAYDLPHGTTLKHESGLDVHVVRDDAVFDATVVGLGCTGFVYDVTLEVEPTYELIERRTLTPWSKVSGRLQQLVTKHRHVEIQINPHADQCQLVVRDRLDEGPDVSGRRIEDRPPAFFAANTPFARGVIGDNVVKMLKDPARAPSQVATRGLNCTAYDEGEYYRGYVSDVLLLNAQYVGLGAEYAVPLERALDAAKYLRTVASDHDVAANDAVAGSDDPFEERFEELLELWRTKPPLVAVISMRFACGEPALLSMTHGPAEQAWCIFEVGMLGHPRHEEDVVRDGKADTKIRRLYAAYDEGRRALFEKLQRHLAELGGRPHWGLYHVENLDWARSQWGDDAIDRWLARYRECNVDGVFDSRFTDALGISTRAGISE